MSDEDAQLSYLCLLTGGAEPGEKLPWVISMHGLGGDAKSHAKMFSDKDFEARVYVPRAPNRFRKGYEWFGAPPWGNPKQFRAGLLDSAGRIQKLIGRLGAQDKNRGAPVVTGYSQGAILSTHLAATADGKIKGAVALAGMLPRHLWPEKRPQRPVPVVALHGTEDQALAFESAKSTYAHLNNLGIPVEFRGYEGEKHKLSDRMYRDWSLALAQMLQN